MKRDFKLIMAKLGFWTKMTLQLRRQELLQLLETSLKKESKDKIWYR